VFSQFDAATQHLLYRAYHTATLILGSDEWSPLRGAAAVAQVTRQLIAAANAGGRDQDRLVQAALDGINP
jgi:hypothetical protein